MKSIKPYLPPLPPWFFMKLYTPKITYMSEFSLPPSWDVCGYYPQGRFRPWFRGDFLNPLRKTLLTLFHKVWKEESLRKLCGNLQFSWSLSHAFLQQFLVKFCDQNILVVNTFGNSELSKPTERRAAKRMWSATSEDQQLLGAEGDFHSFFLYFDVYSWLREMV